MNLKRIFPALVMATAALMGGSLRAAPAHNEIRVATPWPAQNTIIAMLGYGDNIVGTSKVAQQIPLFSQSLPQIKSVPVVSMNSGRELDPEQIISLRARLLFIPSGTKIPRQEVLEQAGVRVLAFEANSMQALTRRVQQTAEALGPDARLKAQRYQRYFDRNMALVRARLQAVSPDKRITVYHSMGSPLTTTGRPSLNQDWMDLAGAINVAEGWFSGQKRSGEVALEQLVAANPAVIVSMNKRDADEIISSPQWASIDAVIHRRVYVNPKGMFWWCRETSEEALQFLWLAKTLYPERFSDVNMQKETRDFYQTFFGLTLSDAQIDDVLRPKK